jgi:hypothetical protein
MANSRIVLNDKEAVGEWVAWQVGRSVPWSSFYAMGVETDGDLTSGLVFTNFNGSNVTVHIAAVKATRQFSTLMDYGHFYVFELCKLRRITALINGDNERALAVNSHLGFVQEGLMKQAGPNGQDVVNLVLWPENYRKGNGRKMKDNSVYTSACVEAKRDEGNKDRSKQNG